MHDVTRVRDTNRKEACVLRQLQHRFFHYDLFPFHIKYGQFAQKISIVARA